MLNHPSIPEHVKAHMQLTDSEGADAGIPLLPCDAMRTRTPSKLFRFAVAWRSRLKLAHDHSTCPPCGAGSEVFLDHALVCPCGDDRTVFHNAIRDALYHSTLDAGIRAEREKNWAFFRPGLAMRPYAAKVWIMGVA